MIRMRIGFSCSRQRRRRRTRVHTETRRHGDARNFLNHEGHENHEDLRPFDWPPKAACRDVRGRRYKPHRRRQRLVSVPSYITAVGVHRTPTIERPSVRLRFFVAPVKPFPPYPPGLTTSTLR